MADYAVIKDNLVINILYFEDPSDELLEAVRVSLDADSLILANRKTKINGEYDGTNFWPDKDFPSWIKDYEKIDWKPPIPQPDDNNGTDRYIWDEPTVSWIKISV